MDKTIHQVIPPTNKERYVIIFIQVNTKLPKSYLLDWKLGASKQVLFRRLNWKKMKIGIRPERRGVLERKAGGLCQVQAHPILAVTFDVSFIR
jgi:hypothetical protein